MKGITAKRFCCALSEAFRLTVSKATNMSILNPPINFVIEVVRIGIDWIIGLHQDLFPK